MTNPADRVIEYTASQAVQVQLAGKIKGINK
jgi:hypothetical protein